MNFANTRELRKSDQPQEFLRGYRDLVLFARRIGLATEAEELRLRDLAARDPKRAAASLKKTLCLREAIYRVVSAVAGQAEAAQQDLAGIDRVWRGALRRSRLVWSDGCFVRSWQAFELDLLTWRLAHSAIALLSGDRLALARECAGVDCGWLFLDTSRNKRRRWCSMRTCGNRAKATRHAKRSARERRPIQEGQNET